MKAGDGVAWESDDEGGECTCVCTHLGTVWCLGFVYISWSLAPTTSYHNTTLTSQSHFTLRSLRTLLYFLRLLSFLYSSVGCCFIFSFIDGIEFSCKTVFRRYWLLNAFQNFTLQIGGLISQLLLFRFCAFLLLNVNCALISANKCHLVMLSFGSWLSHLRLVSPKNTVTTSSSNYIFLVWDFLYSTCS